MKVAQFLTASDVAKLLGVTPGAVRLMQQRGRLACAERTEGGIHLYSRTEVERLAVERASAKRGLLAASRDGGRR